MDFLGPPLGHILFIHDAGEAKQLDQLPADANTSPNSATERYAAGEITSEEYEERRAKLLRDAKLS
jgi:uncharacterized membrane protein